MNRPNILFIHVDQMHWEAMSAYGNPHVKTPNLDRIAADGCSFRTSYTTMPQCCPARASWYTGRMSSETGVPVNGCRLLRGMPDLGQWLPQHGDYKSVYAGKWHIPGRNVEKSFDYIFNSGEGEYSDAGIARACMGFLDNYKGDKPFFLNAGFMNPHDCCYTGAGHGKYSFAGEIDGQLPPLPKNWDKMKVPRLGHWTKQDWQYYIYVYYRWVEMVDAEIGRLYNALMNSRFADNTVVIFAADHGDGLGFHGNISKGYMEEEAWRVPTIIVDPGRATKGTQDNEHLSIGVDIPATICDYAQVPMLPKMTIGKSLRPLVEGKKVDDWHEYIVGETFLYFTNDVAVRDMRHKTIIHCEDQSSRVFDLDADPLEMNDLATTPIGKAVIEKHTGYLREYIDKIDLCTDVPKGRHASSYQSYLNFYANVKKGA